MGCRKSLLLALGLGILNLCMCFGANAHSPGLSLLKLEETGLNRYRVTWIPADELIQRGLSPSPGFPDQCQYSVPILHCDDGNQISANQPLLVGFSGLPRHAEVVLQIQRANGQSEYQVMTDGVLRLARAGKPTAALPAFLNYLWIGIEHIVLGYDHLLFVICLLLLVGFNKTLIWTVSAFTLSHSLTLGLSIFKLVSLPIAPVEVVIAVSIVLVAREVLAECQSLSRKLPWLVALFFGLIHGLGFASALGAIGLPSQQELLALLAFNLGVEIGQLMVIAVLFVGYRLIFALPSLPVARLRLAACYLCGCAGAWWVIERSWSVVSEIV